MGLSEGNKIVENLFFAVTCISTFTCIVRSDYNFAMGLLCYYMIKNTGDNKNFGRTARTVSRLKLIARLLTCWILVDCSECSDNHFGHPLDHYHAINLEWKAHQERHELESFRLHSRIHPLSIFC